MTQSQLVWTVLVLILHRQRAITQFSYFNDTLIDGDKS